MSWTLILALLSPTFTSRNAVSASESIDGFKSEAHCRAAADEAVRALAASGVKVVATCTKVVRT